MRAHVIVQNAIVGHISPTVQAGAPGTGAVLAKVALELRLHSRVGVPRQLAQHMQGVHPVQERTFVVLALQRLVAADKYSPVTVLTIANMRLIGG